MHSVFSNLRTRPGWKLLVLALTCSIFIACNDDGPTAPTTAPVARPTATPIPIPNVAGQWTGRLVPCQSQAVCGGPVSVAATFVQEDVHVNGTIGGGTFRGELSANRLSGSLVSRSNTYTASGTASATHISLSWNTGIFGRGSLTLDR